MSIHRYIFPMSIHSVEARDDRKLVKVAFPEGVFVTFELPTNAEIKSLKLILEADENAIT